MARGKKKEKELTLEELLAQALVPAVEQPYPVPENWCWTSLKYATDLFNGDRGINYPSKKDYQTMGIPFINAGAIVDGELCEAEFNFISEEKYNSLHAGKIEEGDILYCLRGSLGKTAIIRTNQKGAISSSLCILRNKTIISNKYLYYLLCSDLIKKQQDSAENGSAQPNLSAASVTNYIIPIAPTNEQRRIVDRIESLFVKLDEAKEKAQAVVDGFETRKAAILHKAFTGELTAKWRQEHGVTLESWKRIRIQDVCEKIVCGKTPKEYITPEAEIPYLKVYNIVNNKVDFQSAPQYIPREIHKNKLKSSILKPHDVIMNIVGPPLRKIAIVPEDYPEWNMNQAIVRFRPYDILNYRFLYYTLVNPETLDEVISATKGVVGQANISVSQSRNLPIQLPLQDEQQEIVRILDTLFAKEQQAKETAEAVLDQIEAMKKSILARAFRGELGTNDPAEESAVELLKQAL